MTFLSAHTPKVYAGLRILAGLMFMQHGLQKLGLLYGSPLTTEPLLLAAGVIETFGGLLVAIGLFASYAAFITSGTMAVAYFMHAFGVAGAPASFSPLINKGELAALYCWVFLLIAAKGAGLWSVDSLRSNRS